MISSPAPHRRLTRADTSLALGLSAALFFFIASGWIAYRNASLLMEDTKAVVRTHRVITSLGNLLSLVKDAETGQRGYLITGEDKYLEPYLAARTELDTALIESEELIRDRTEMRTLFATVKVHLGRKIVEMEETIAIRRAQGLEAARTIVESDRGKMEMDAVRDAIKEMIQLETTFREGRIASMQQAYQVAIVSGFVTALIGIGLSIAVAWLIQRVTSARRREDWLQGGKVGMAVAVAGDQRIERLGESVLAFLAKYLDAHAGVLYTRDGGHFRKAATFGVPADSQIPERFELGDGLLGRAAVATSPILINDVPEGYLTVGSGLGRGKPRYLIVAPIAADESVNGVLELGFIHPLDNLSLELLKQLSDQVSVAVRSSQYRESLQQLLEETQRQAEELQAQSEELRVSNEELEEQSRALKESQSRLEQQQAELEQTNSQLEEQTQLLEVQRDDISRAKVEVETKAEELKQASQYKSDFLANMSHELRTPLNSLLILSKLLADNANNNLSTEQVDFARTIYNSGNDLLLLINDILDLSKIEAGHMEVHADSMSIERLVLDLARVFEPMAAQKNLEFITRVTSECPELMETDRQRLEQILKNLLANACKFTERGQVELTVSFTSNGEVSFAVRDTGIGISLENQQGIFEAFHQAESNISRRFGGTGLGLSISRELARLLGGTIQLQSKPGEGSTFTLSLPVKYVGRLPVAGPPPLQPTQPEKSAVASTPPQTPRRFIRDDRETLVSGKRLILLVEDDESFARILFEMVHEQQFQCLVATTAEDALILARQYLPSAVLLDVGLPDNSGLTVLDRLKQDTRTRHIPIHVISANDYSETAYSLGAIGYMVKPVRREDLVDALRQLEDRLSGSMRRVLIVEDDAVQRESLAKLLGSNEVEAVTVGTAAESLEKLKDSTFDCMVLDLSLPDASGYSVLETLSNEHAYSFPPVIVYTGYDLSSEEEQKLRRYSKSIIIKGVKSPERLLDEVTLFLHQVVAELPAEQQSMLKKAQNRDSVLEGRRILVVEDDVRNIYSLTSILEPRGAVIQIARNGREALEALAKSKAGTADSIDLVLMDVMMPEMDGLTATREIRKRAEWKKLPIIMLTAKAMRNDQERCLDAGANDYMAKPLDVEKLLSLVRVWMPR